MNNNTRTIRSEEITIDMRVLTIMEDGRKNGEIYLAAIAPDMELTVITLDEAPDILPCFDEDDACVNIPDSTLMLCYNPAQVLELGGKHYLTGPVILMRIDMKVKDIAAMEGITPSQAGKSIHAALRRLRRYFARQKWTVNL